MISIGTSGYNYHHWRGVFYLENLSQKKWLEYYLEFLNSVELNVTFYRLPTESAFESWYRRTTPNFTFALKGSRFITHIKRLKDPQDPLKLFFTRAKRLKHKHRVTLWQLPPGFKVNEERLGDFVQSLKEFSTCLHAFEFRDQSWFTKTVFEILRLYGMSICIADWPEMEISIPTDLPFLYLRRHGPESGSLYSGCYSKTELKKDAQEIIAWSRKGREVFTYFNNDSSGYAVKNAIQLKEMVEGKRRM
jgi:uncharacterized protein YecE (DUF72 family)